MASVKQIEISGTIYDIKDETTAGELVLVKADIASIKTKQTQQDGKITTLTASVENANSDIAAQAATIGAQGNKIQTIETSVTAINNANLPGRLDNVEAKNTAQDSAITNNTNRIAALEASPATGKIFDENEATTIQTEHYCYELPSGNETPRAQPVKITVIMQKWKNRYAISVNFRYNLQFSDVPAGEHLRTVISVKLPDDVTNDTSMGFYSEPHVRIGKPNETGAIKLQLAVEEGYKETYNGQLSILCDMYMPSQQAPGKTFEVFMPPPLDMIIEINDNRAYKVCGI